jgi:hypothetical protein
MRQAISVEHQIVDLFSQLQRLVRHPTWSFQLEEIRTLVTELAACWEEYRRSGGCDDRRPPEEPGCVEAAEHRALGRPDRAGLGPRYRPR